MNNTHFTSLVALFAIAASIVAVAPVQGKPIAIQPVDLVPVGESRLSGGIHFEKGRSLAETAGGNQLEYDNTRIRALDLRMGILDNLEINMGVNYSDNSANTNNPNTPDEAGIEGILLGTKLKFHPNISAQLTGKFNGSSDVHPYGSDNPAFRANIPIEFKLGNGMFHTEGGITVQSGDVTDGSGNVIGSWTTYGNYGVGYTYEANYFTDISMEVIGHTATAESTGNLDFNDHLSLLFGADIRIARGVHIRPSTSFALMEGSPNVMFGLDYEIAFEGRHFRRTEREEPEERYSERQPVGGASPEPKQKDTGMTDTRTKTQPTSQPTGKQKINALMEKGYRAAEKGNLEKALRHYRAAADIDPNSLLVQSNLGSLYYRMGNYRKARTHYRKAVNANPNDTFSLLYLGASHYQLGNRQAARQYFERVKRLDPDNERVQQWLEKME